VQVNVVYLRNKILRLFAGNSEDTERGAKGKRPKEDFDSVRQVDVPARQSQENEVRCPSCYHAEMTGILERFTNI